jgi:glutathione S-transferase
MQEVFKMKLYYSPGVCSLSPHIVAREAAIPLTLIKVDTNTHTTEDGRDFYQINPLGYVPVLELDNGALLREGPAIVQYLADLAPKTQLAPASGSLDRVRLQEWLTFIGTELHKQFYWLFHPAPDEIRTAQREKVLKGLGELDRALEKRPFLTGGRFTVADAYAFTVVNWCNFVSIDLKSYRNLQAFMARVAERPKVREALKAEGLLQG